MELTELYLRAFLVTHTEDEEENLIKQVLKDQETAKAYNDLMKANAQVVKHNINITREHQIVEGLEKRIEELDKQIQYEFDVQNNVDAEGEVILKELQKVMDVWTDKHTKIVKESEEKFKTHTKDQEVDI